ncbi:hypothetical protein JL720_5691 [Aureococcus anophagefferens]|nr:hypothetical protein JL720_5691 [Aureococcus anophagefferens]
MEDAVAYRLVDSPTPTVRSWDATDDAPRPMDGRLVTAAYALLSFGAGALQVVNVGFNAEVAAVVASPIVASALTPPIALASLLAVDPCAGSAKRPTSGVLAAIWVGISVVACKRLSLASFFILNTLGRCAASVVVDATGALGFPKLGVDAFAVSGLALACVGAAILQRGSPATGPEPPTKTGLELTAAPLAGDTLAVDAALA